MTASRSAPATRSGRAGQRPSWEPYMARPIHRPVYQHPDVAAMWANCVVFGAVAVVGV